MKWRYFNIKRLLIFIVGGFIGLDNVFAQTETILNLNSGWKFLYNNQWYQTDVPNSIHTDLYNNKLIGDPFFSDNESKTQWIDSLDWTYQKEFDVSESVMKRQNVELHFDGLDTYADVFLNDSLVLQADNMFRAWTVSCKKLLRPKKNTLKIVFHSAVKKSGELYNKYKFKNLPGGERVMTRKAQYHFGWDFAPRFVTCGISGDIKLHVWDFFKVRNISVQTHSIKADNAFLNAFIEIHSKEKSPLLIIITDKATGTPINFFQTQMDTGINKIQVPFKIDNPVLWWCNGMGKPHNYHIEVSITDGKENNQKSDAFFGLRTIEVVQQPDSAGASFYFRLNNKPVFMKGANYVPQDMFLNRPSPARYDSLLSAVKDAGMNMLRVWGGGIYEKDIFYSLCNKYGILVWQDFMFACGMYPIDEIFLQSVKSEAEQQVKRLANHPCIALWCGNNENSEGWHRWEWQSEYNEKEREQIWNGYLEIFTKILPGAVSKYSQTFYWETSPQFGRGDEQHTKKGDAHNWFVWHDGEPFENYEQKIPRFMSEFGFQSLPDMETILSFCADSAPAINSDCIRAHQKHSKGFSIINSYMQKQFGNIPGDLNEYVNKSQQVQADGISKGIKAHLRAIPYCMGSLVWQLNDCWPAISWSMIDYHGRKKKLYFETQKLFKE